MALSQTLPPLSLHVLAIDPTFQLARIKIDHNRPFADFDDVAKRTRELLAALPPCLL